jgi:hypothetical protein
MTKFRIQHERDLELIAPIDVEKYEAIPLQPLVVYSLFWLHEWELRRTIESVAILSWRLFPAKFSMVGWKQFPDQLRTNRSLMQCGPKYRNWVSGAAVNGYSLNQRGIEKAEELIQQIGPPILGDGSTVEYKPHLLESSKKSRARSIEPEREVERAREGRLFKKWKEGIMSERDLVHVHTLLAVFDHTPTRIRTKKMKDLERAAEDVGDAEVGQFIKDIRENFPMFFGR